MPSDPHTTRPREFAADRWILETDARSAIVSAQRTLARTPLVGSLVRVDGCDYRCVAVEPAPGARLRLFVESL
jgi:hypothetical protein